jgi:hypothetical protein
VNITSTRECRLLVWLDDDQTPWDWGWDCLTCNETSAGHLTKHEAQAAADTHKEYREHTDD